MMARAATPGQDDMRACDPAEQHRAGQVLAVAWHALSASEAASRQVVETAIGLQTGDVGARRARYGENRLAEKPPRSKWLAFLDQFKSLLILVLIGAAALAGAIGDLKDAVVILAVVLFNAVLGFWQEHRAEATLAALKKMLSPVARVKRGGQVEELAAAQLVPGDLVMLEAGDRVPADGRLLACHSVEIDEAALTGESHPVAKDAERTVAAESPLAERVNMAYMNTVVTRGRAELLVTATGMATEMGRLSGMLAQAEAGPTPLQVQLDVLGRRLALIAGIVIALIFALGWARGEPLVQIVLTSIALAVAAIPEGLPAVVTVTLAIGMHRMAQHRAIVKKLAAVETLGCTTVICSDKTGTLTRGALRLDRVHTAPGTTEPEVLAWAAALEEGSEHPIARAVRAAAGDLPRPACASFRALPGRGVTATVTLAGKVLPARLGTAEHVGEVPAFDEPGATVIHLGIDGHWRGSLVLRDELRPEAPATVRALTAQGLAVEVLSGDSAAAVSQLSDRLPGIAATGSLAPEAKLERVQAAVAAGECPAMIGDGINDAPALSNAGVAITLESGTDLAREVSDVTILGGDLSRLPWLFDLGRQTLKTARRNLTWAFLYNGIGLCLAVSGYLHPLFGAVGMVASGLLVVLHSQRLARFPLPHGDLR
ncbi:MAG TPA: hypothetical protein DD490_06070 [Acidobacteria bacterium]|nr:hypothetical protein [Acidobacteriota bacterium]